MFYSLFTNLLNHYIHLYCDILFAGEKKRHHHHHHKSNNSHRGEYRDPHLVAANTRREHRHNGHY